MTQSVLLLLLLFIFCEWLYVILYLSSSFVWLSIGPVTGAGGSGGENGIILTLVRKLLLNISLEKVINIEHFMTSNSDSLWVFCCLLYRQPFLQNVLPWNKVEQCILLCFTTYTFPWASIAINGAFALSIAAVLT